MRFNITMEEFQYGVTRIIFSSGCHKVLVNLSKYLEDSKLSPSCPSKSFNY